MLHDVTVQTKRAYECARVEGVPPEEFGIARNARCISDADYCFHEVLKSEAELIEQGYDREQVRKLPSLRRRRPARVAGARHGRGEQRRGRATTASTAPTA